MAATLWLFRNLSEGRWKKVSRSWYDRFWNGDEAIEDVTELRFAEIALMLKNRKPIMHHPQTWYTKIPLHADGRLADSTKSEMMAGAAAAMESMFPGEQTPGTVIEASSKFTTRRHDHQFRWTPSQTDLAALRQALIKRGLPPAATVYITDKA